jgi:hypothetical protein
MQRSKKTASAVSSTTPRRSASQRGFTPPRENGRERGFRPPVRTACRLWTNENPQPAVRLYSHGDIRSKRQTIDRAAREAPTLSLSREGGWFLLYVILRFSYLSRFQGQHGMGAGTSEGVLRLLAANVEPLDALRSRSSKIHPGTSPS